MNTTYQIQTVDGLQTIELSEEQIASLEVKREQSRLDSIVRSAEFWASTEDMTMEEILKFHKYELKRHEINRSRTVYTETKIKHNREIEKITEVIKILEVEN